MLVANAFPNPETTITTPSREIFSLTSVRGLAALWVVLFHFEPILFQALPELSLMRPLIGAGEFAVPLFFILSGYVLGLRYTQPLSTPSASRLFRFWWLRLGRIYPVHLATLLLSIGMAARHGWPTDEGHTRTSFIANCFLTQAWNYKFRLSWNYPSWSLSSEWFAYLIFPIVAITLVKLRRGWLFFLAGAACALSVLVYASEQNLVFKGLCLVTPTFIGGVILAAVWPPSAEQALRRYVDCGVVLAIVLPFLGTSIPMLGALYLLLFFVMVGMIGVVGNDCSSLWRSRLLIFLGDISYSLYMTHVVTITLITKYIPCVCVPGETFAARLTFVAGDMVLIVFAAMIVYYTIERPLREVSRRAVGRFD